MNEDLWDFIDLSLISWIGLIGLKDENWNFGEAQSLNPSFVNNKILSPNLLNLVFVLF